MPTFSIRYGAKGPSVMNRLAWWGHLVWGHGDMSLTMFPSGVACTGQPLAMRAAKSTASQSGTFLANLGSAGNKDGPPDRNRTCI